MALETAYYSASGPALDDCYFLAQRYEGDSGYKPYEAECWVCGVKPGKPGAEPYYLTYHYGSTGWLTRLWRSPSGRVYVSSAEGKIFVNGSLSVDDGKGQWQTTEVKTALFGIWGLDDDNVFAWGSRMQDRSLYRFDGKSWSEIAHPGFEIDSMHGLSPSFIYAVGEDGAIARFDGKSWQRSPGPTTEQLTSVFVAGPDEMYAVGAAGSVLEGSAHGWGKIAEGPGLPGPLQCVAKFKDELWVGAGRFGLGQRKGKTNQIDVTKPKVLAVSLDVRQDIVVATKNFIVGSKDGSNFTGTGNGWLLKQLANKPLCFFG